MFGATMQNSNWKTKKLADIATIFDGQHTTPRYTHTGVPFYSAENVSTGILPKYISVKEYESQAKHKKPQKGDILLTRIGSLGKNIIANWEGPYAIYVTIAIIRPNPTVLTEYLHHYLDSYTYQREFFSKALLTAYPQKINLEDLLSTKVSYPNIEEQRRIVEVLECWDKGIELVKKLIEQKELQKKGLLQNLVYNQPTCKNFYLGNLFSLGRGRVISKEEIQHNKGTYPVYSSQTSDNGILGYINSFDFEGEYLTWTTDGANAGKVFYRRGQFNCTNVCGTAKPHNSNLVNLYYVMSYLNKVTKRYVSYVGNPKLMNGVFSKIAIPLPEKTTQDWAATVLETADKEIDLLKQKLAKLEAQKKGLMQVLLTGKIRLK